jgi:uncharacterized membrane protein
MSGGALALALGAALLHASWNVLLAGSRDSVAATGALLVWGTVALAPAALLTGGVSDSAAPFIAASAVLELLYFALLARAYDSGEVGVVYPTARGTAPVIVLLVGAAALGEEPAGLAVAGILLIAAGVWFVGHDMRAEGTKRDLGFGLAIAAAIAGYTLVDNEGIEHADPLAYQFLVTVAIAAAYCAGLAARGRGTELRRSVAHPKAALTGAATVAAYAMVLLALERAPAAPVAAVRESSVVIAAVMAWAFLEEPLRIGPAVLVAAGVAAIVLS